MANTKDWSTRLSELENLEQLVKKSFLLEQRIHEKYGYFDADWHETIHELYIKKLQIAKRYLAQTGITLENEQIFRWQVAEFFKAHIMCHDRAFAHFYHEKNFARKHCRI